MNRGNARRCGNPAAAQCGTVVATYVSLQQLRAVHARFEAQAEDVASGQSHPRPVSSEESSVGTLRRRSFARKGRAGSSARPALVCGGAGFLGAHLCARLLTEGRRVLCVDNFCTSTPEAIEKLIPQPRFELIEQDIALLDDDFGAEFAVHDIFNLACAASPVLYQRSPLDTLFSSVRGMDNLLRIASRCGATVFQASTSEVYGHPTMHPQSENYWGYVNPIGPRACYDEGKRCAETLCFIYRQHYGVPVRIARIFNTYGPGMRLRDGRVVINFIVQAL